MAGYIGSGASVVSSGAENKKVFDITTNTTSLTGLNYTVGKVHVYHNGVRLVDGTDYTATNSTSITLTVAAVSGDQVVVVSYASFQVADALLTSGGTLTGDLTVQGAFTSQGIDDNGNATAITIDSSENVLVGKASSSTTTAGNELRAGGLAAFTRSGSYALNLNRLSSDGDIAVFQKDNTTVGSIATYGGDLIVGTGDTRLRFVDSLDSLLPVSDSTGTSRDAGIDLGHSETRFKDIYTSGGIYLGAASSSTPVAANKLEDYEEGSYIAGFATQNGSIALLGTHNTMNYTKIGRQVTITGRVVVNTVSGASGWVRFGLPFTNVSESEDEGHTILNVTTYKVNGIGTGQVFAEIGPSTPYGILLKTVDNVGWAYLDASGFGTNDIIYMNGTYLTNS